MNFLEGIITGRAAVEAPADTAAGASANSRMSAPARLHQPDGDGTSDNEVDAAAEAAVLQVEADLQDAFEKMHDVEERLSSTEPEAKTPSAALLKFNASISTVVKKNKVVRAFGKKHFEQEGSDALLFDSVPAWIKFTRISGYRYRLLTSIQDPDDEFELYTSGITFFGTPGASGWADKIGDVAIHYMTPRWVVFSKVFPFEEQGEAREAHEDVLLLGSSRHVMLTPCCAHRIGEGGLRTPSSWVMMLTGDGSSTRRETTVSKAPPALLARLFLTWAHEDGDFALETSGLTPPDLPALIAAPEGIGAHAKRLIGTLFRNFGSGGKPPVHEHWNRYPVSPLDPSYYQQLLATASSMSEAEQRARALIEPRATPRKHAGDGEDPAPPPVTLSVQPEFALPGERESMYTLQHV